MFTDDSPDRRNSDERELIQSIRRSPIASVVTNPRADDNPIIAANRQFEQLTGYAESELIGRNCRMLAGPETERAHSAALAHAVAAASTIVLELVNYRKDGSRFLNAVMIAPVFDDRGMPAYFVGSQMEVAVGQSDHLRASAAARIGQLTRQQQSVLRLVARGMRNRQIGEQLGVTEKTIKMHRSALVRRLGVSTMAEAMRLGIEAGF
ncbi:PAS domain-containing protein [Croceibacterium ferulae]|uniref:PAS domain-containing protein n=1 Tax=Croceibacterium ferulae TaxID=1854641 RepID=UPI000EB17CF2|nr:PAS domain-containing protein [Croceibacterium ferulae]